MPYMLLIVEPLGQRRERGPEAGQAAYQQMIDYRAQMEAAGVLLASNSLAAPARRLQLRDGAARWTDGPFAEAKEMVGGFFYLNCATREQAQDWAERCPAASWCSVEVREVAPCFDDG
jgi:hypothetical protein